MIVIDTNGVPGGTVGGPNLALGHVIVIVTVIVTGAADTTETTIAVTGMTGTRIVTETRIVTGTGEVDVIVMIDQDTNGPVVVTAAPVGIKMRRGAVAKTSRSQVNRTMLKSHAPDQERPLKDTFMSLCLVLTVSAQTNFSLHWLWHFVCLH